MVVRKSRDDEIITAPNINVYMRHSRGTRSPTNLTVDRRPYIQKSNSFACCCTNLLTQPIMLVDCRFYHLEIWQTEDMSMSGPPQDRDKVRIEL